MNEQMVHSYRGDSCYGYVQQSGMHIVYITVYVLTVLFHYAAYVIISVMSSGCADTEEVIVVVRSNRFICRSTDRVSLPWAL